MLIGSSNPLIYNLYLKAFKSKWQIFSCSHDVCAYLFACVRVWVWVYGAASIHCLLLGQA